MPTPATWAIHLDKIRQAMAVNIDAAPAGPAAPFAAQPLQSIVQQPAGGEKSAAPVQTQPIQPAPPQSYADRIKATLAQTGMTPEQQHAGKVERYKIGQEQEATRVAAEQAEKEKAKWWKGEVGGVKYDVGHMPTSHARAYVSKLKLEHALGQFKGEQARQLQQVKEGGLLTRTALTETGKAGREVGKAGRAAVTEAGRKEAREETERHHREYEALMGKRLDTSKAREQRIADAERAGQVEKGTSAKIKRIDDKITRLDKRWLNLSTRKGKLQEQIAAGAEDVSTTGVDDKMDKIITDIQGLEDEAAQYETQLPGETISPAGAGVGLGAAEDILPGELIEPTLGVEGAGAEVAEAAPAEGEALPKPTQPGQKLSEEGAAKYMAAFNNDKALAREQAKKDGWKL